MAATHAPNRGGARQICSGFTIVELMMAILVLAILVGLAMPSFRELTIRSNVTQISNSLVHALNLARAEAARRGTSVEIVSASGSATWSNGWATKADTNFDGTYATTLNVAGAVGTGYSVCAASTGGGAASTIVFKPDGTLSGATSFDINVNRPDGNAQLSQRITVGGSGVVTSKIGTSGSPAATSCS